MVLSSLSCTRADRIGTRAGWPCRRRHALVVLPIIALLASLAVTSRADPADGQGPVLLNAGYLIVTCPGCPPPPTSPEIQVIFDEAVDPATATDAANYTFFETENPENTIEVAAIEHYPEWYDDEVMLLLVEVPPAVNFTLAVGNVEDLEGNVMDPGQYVVIEPIVIPDDVPPLAPARPVLWPGVPNPFNPRTTIAVELGRDERAALTVVDLAGRLVTTLADRPFTAGPHAVTWDGRDAMGRALPSGTYVVRLETGSGRRATKVTLVR